MASANVRTIVLVGDSAGDSGEDAAFGSFTTPSLNNRGQVAFASQLAGADVATSNDTGYWIAGNGGLQSVVREGAPAPGMPAGSMFGHAPSLFTGFVPLNDAGELAVGYPVTLPDSTTSSGLWVGNQQSLSLLAAQGTPAPSAQNNAAFAGLSNVRVSLNRKGDAAFYANLTAAPYTTINTNSYNDGLWILNRGGSPVAVLAGDSAAALGEDAQFVGFTTYYHPAVNRHGNAAVNAFHRLPTGPSYVPSIWVVSENGVELRTASGQPLPEVGVNGVVSHVSQPGFNSAGTTAFDGNFSSPSASPPSGTFVMVSEADGYSLPAYSGGPASGLPGEQFRETFYEPSLGSGGHIAFYGSTWDGVRSLSGVWTGRPDVLELVALQGAVAPNANATFGPFFRSTPSVNRFGQIAFRASLFDLQGGAGTSSIWATDLDGNPVLIARSGETLEVADGDVRTISSLLMQVNHGDDDGRPRGLNDLGQIAFRAVFTDGTSGIFLSNAVAHLPGDYNGDGTVDTGDYLVWRKATATQDLVADGDRDRIVGDGDQAIWREFFGMSLAIDADSGGAAVPEPAAGLLIAAIGVAICGHRRTAGAN